MEHYQIINIKEVLEKKEGVAYQGEIGVFVTGSYEKSVIYWS